MREFLKFFLTMCLCVVVTGILSCNEEENDAAQFEKAMSERDKAPTPKCEVIDDEISTVYISNEEVGHRTLTKDIIAMFSAEKNAWQKENPQKKVIGASLNFTEGGTYYIRPDGLFLIYEIVPLQKDIPKEEPVPNTNL